MSKERAVNSVSRWDRKEYVFSGREMKLKRYEVIRTDQINKALDRWLLKNDREWFMFHKHEWRSWNWHPVMEKVALLNMVTGEEMLGTVVIHPYHGEIINWEKGTPPIHPLYRHEWVIKNQFGISVAECCEA